VVRRASGRLAASPLHDLVQAHLRRLSRRAGEFATDPGAAALGTATTELVRALLASAAQDERFSRPVLADTLVTRVLAYLREHLTDPSLSPQSIAHAHRVSVRQLYKVFAAADLSLEQWVIDQRLEADRTALASADRRRRSIAATAHASGFRDASHFTRRFRAAYGVTPRDWQQINRRD
jgi:AraC-like DNA-binding protein